MSSPEVAVRLEELLAGAFPETQDEARLQGLARELRSASVAAPSSLRERVAGIGASAQPRLRRPSRRLVAVLAVTLLVLAAGTFAALRFSTENRTASNPAPAAASRHTERGVPQVIQRNLQEKYPPLTSGSGIHEQSAQPLGRAASRAPAQSDRVQDIDMWIDLRVSDADKVSSASQDAVRITRELGGVVTSSTVDTRGTQGRAQLTLRIPVRNLDDAVFRLTQLGTVTAQRTNTEDLQTPLDRVSRRIAEFRSKIRIELARLASGQLTAAEELAARIHLENLRRNLDYAKRSRASIVSKTSMADLTFRLATGAPGAVDRSESGIAGAVDKAADFLRGAGAVAVFVALVLSPLIVLAILAWLALRARSRRIEARLLDEPQPGTPTRSS
ncbi:MAG TPA: DUF4349 domain-containing protein [Gaiellaceae bacterium]|nr:DUF4349 domain-containing protein [Gaiellaceae bacterium]